MLLNGTPNLSLKLRSLGLAMKRNLVGGRFLFILLLVGGTSVHAAQQKIPRGVLPSSVTANRVVLCKSSPSIENTYEIRLIMLLAVKRQKVFELKVPPNAVVAPDLAALISQQGGRISQQECTDFTVSFTHFDTNKKEADSWVLGNASVWESFRASLHSPWLQAELRPGTSFSGPQLLRFKQELSGEVIRLKNIDERMFRWRSKD